MGKIKKILENELVGGTQSTDVYPITSVKAVYDENNERLDNIISKMEFDVSLHNNGAVFESLQALLSSSNLSTLIPTSVRHGGMVIRFIQGSEQSSNNKYVQYFLTKDDWSISASDWERHNDITTSNQSVSDLDFSDEYGNVLVRFQDGGIKTKNFDSSKDATEEERGLMSSVDKTKINGIEEGAQVNDVIIDDVEDADLDFSDEEGHIVMRVANGHIKTNNFDSSKIPTNLSQAMSISLSGIYNRDNPFGVNPNIVYKDAAKRTLPNNVIPLIVIAGQSNADGRAPYNTASNWESTKWLADANYSVENYNMWKASVKTFETYNVLTNNGADSGSGSDGSGEDKFSFDPFFAKKFIEVFNTPLYAVRETLGGIGIEDYVVRAGKKNTWQPKIGYIENKYGITDVNYLILRLLEKINDIKKWCDNNNKILFPIAILWHQGEHDADASLITSFKENTSEVISFMRGIFQAPALPFINGFVQKDYNANYAKVNQIFLELNEIDDYMKTVDMAGHYTSIGDGLHYDGQSLAYMGEQMFNYYKQLNSLI